ncbi:MAG: NADPH-dependent oxidoreductase [Salinarimonadaceae bacterium]|nr:MAG: NADPH-dependent oxidoreductase [Salinarimonadaceae bacterium]
MEKPEDKRPLIVGIGGTPRPQSSSERALAISLEAARDCGARTIMISGPDLMVPMYTPDQSQRTPEALRLVEAIRSCEGLIVSSPAYHGSLSGLIKNALDYTEDLREDPRVYLDGVAVGLIACAGGWQAGAQTLATLRGIVHALRGWPTPMGASINTSTGVFDESGACVDLGTTMQLRTVGEQVVEFARMRGMLAAPPPRVAM